MNYNVCQTCGAKDGRAGVLIGTKDSGFIYECQNCHDTRKNGVITLHANLKRTDEEIEKTMNILNIEVL